MRTRSAGRPRKRYVSTNGAAARKVAQSVLLTLSRNQTTAVTWLSGDAEDDE
jgi:hypothetical protein